MNTTKLFHEWVFKKLEEYVAEHPKPKREDYPYQEAYESSLWSWTSCYQTRVHYYQGQEEGFRAALEISLQGESK